MSFHKSIRSRRGRKTIHKDFELQLTSMLDILVIILVFLLKTYATSTNSFSSMKDIQLPVSQSKNDPLDSLHLIVKPEAIYFESERVVEFVQTADSVGSADPTYTLKPEDLDQNGVIRVLFEKLVKARQLVEERHAKASFRDAEGNPVPFDGILAIQADKRVKYDMLRKIMFTAGLAEFRVMRLLARKEEQ
jgi:biopolymer transport protein ExbD